jgi:putative PIN family toxin of toxin-antitoxin system
MSSFRIVLDTNVLLRSISRRSEYAIVLDMLYKEVFELYLSNEILLEYEEKITEIFSSETAELLIGAFTLLDNVKKSEVHFHLNLITVDPDDNKFSDCAFSANAHYLVTNDKHFNILKSISFPRIHVVTLEQFKQILLTR